jgi:hypothetical protein
MNILVDDKELLKLTEIQKKVIKDYVHAEKFKEDINRRILWVFSELYEESFKRLKKRWDPILVSEGIDCIPKDRDEYAKLVLSRRNYKDRSARDRDRSARDIRDKKG